MTHSRNTRIAPYTAEDLKAAMERLRARALEREASATLPEPTAAGADAAGKPLSKPAKHSTARSA